MMQGWCKDEALHLEPSLDSLGFGSHPNHMAKVKLNSALAALSGNIDGFVFKHYKSGIVVSRRPDMRGIKPSPAQKAQRARFRAAAEHHRAVLANPALHRKFAAEAKKRGVPISALTLAAHMKKTRVEKR